jgi:hypothetical protein
MHPECMALATQAVGIALGTASLNTAAAIQRCDKTRWTVLPLGSDAKQLIDEITRIPCYIRKQKSQKSGWAIKHHNNMQQGVRALGAALVNTVFTVGFDIMQKQLCADIKDSAILTTSDDSVRGCTLIKNHLFAAKDIFDDYIQLPIEQLHHCMMKDSSVKAIMSGSIAEFNNVATGPHGMFPQSFVHPHLCIQPLIGVTLLADLISTVSNARMSIPWGDAISVARANYNANLVLFCQRWLLTPEHISILETQGFLPKNDEELIAGGFHFDDDTKWKLLQMLDEETRQMVYEGEVKITRALSSIGFKKPFSKMTNAQRKKKKINTDFLDNFVLKHNILQIVASRMTGGKMKASVVRPAPLDKRREATHNFFKELGKLREEPSTEIKEMAEKILTPPRVKIIMTTVTEKSLMPVIQGGRRNITDDLSLNVIMAQRFSKIHCTQMPNEAENEIINMKETDFKNWYSQRKVSQRTVGLKFSCPSGRPLSLSHNDKFYPRGASFGFTVDLPDVENTNKLVLTMNNETYDNVSACWWTQVTLKKVQKTRLDMPNVLACGYDLTGTMLTVFYQEFNRRASCLKIDTSIIPKEKIYVKATRRVYVHCSVKTFATPIQAGHFGLPAPATDFKADICGDPTALLNYGNYLNTSANGAVKMMQRVYRKFNSTLPYFINKFKPKYPLFAKKPTEIKSARVNKLLGYKSILSLKITFAEKPINLQTINLQLKVPFIQQEDDDDDSEDEIMF